MVAAALRDLETDRVPVQSAPERRAGRAREGLEQVLELQSDQVGAVVLGAFFCFIGLAACAIAGMRRRRRGTRMLAWFGVFAGMYGLRILADTPAPALLPSWAWPGRGPLVLIVTYFILVPASLLWLEMSLGVLRTLIRATAGTALAIGIAGIATVLWGGPPDRFMAWNNLLAIAWICALAAVNVIPALSRRYMTTSTPALKIGVLVALSAALYTNLAGLLSYEPASVEPLAFAFFILSLGYAAAQQVFRDELRLLSIEKELEIARGIQRSILPAAVPQVGRLRIATAYRPMTAVAGDFYEVVEVGHDRAGFFVADVSGHGVPAALIASMIKVAMGSVASQAGDPGGLLRELNGILGGQLHGQFVTAAYLYVDLTVPRAVYSAAGHPPLLYWDSAKGELRPIESNGPLIGLRKHSDYPVRELEPRRGDRFLLYTDGLVETEDAAGEFFGDRRLGELIRSHGGAPAGELSLRLLEEVEEWRPSHAEQQDDITWIIVDVL